MRGRGVRTVERSTFYADQRGTVDVRAVRAYVREALAAVGDAAVLDDVELMVGELVGNAVRYTASGQAGGSVTAMVGWGPDRVRVSITDDGGAVTRPRLVMTADLLEEGGRGLRMVATMAAAWGINLGPAPREEASVWFEVSINEG